MKRHYLHVSAYSCDKCGGPVISGSTGVRENEISRETDMREVGAICLSCGHRQANGRRPRLSASSVGWPEDPRRSLGQRLVWDAQSCRTTLRSELWTCSP